MTEHIETVISIMSNKPKRYEDICRQTDLTHGQVKNVCERLRAEGLIVRDKLSGGYQLPGNEVLKEEIVKPWGSRKKEPQLRQTYY